jgi:hypothetical protein
MKFLYNFLPLLLSFLTFVSCGEGFLGETPEKVVVPVQYSMDGVKLISPHITDPRDLQSMTRPEYLLNSERRLLVRFEDFISHSSGVVVDDETRVHLTLTCPFESLA